MIQITPELRQEVLAVWARRSRTRAAELLQRELEMTPLEAEEVLLTMEAEYLKQAGHSRPQGGDGDQLSRFNFDPGCAAITLFAIPVAVSVSIFLLTGVPVSVMITLVVIYLIAAMVVLTVVSG